MGYAILLFHFYVYCHHVFQQLGLPLELLNRFIRSLNNTTHAFDRVWFSKLVALFFLLIYVLGNKSKKNITATWSRAFLFGISGLLLYFGSNVILNLRGLNYNLINLFYVLTTITGYMVLVKAAGVADSIINLKMGNDPFNEENESFMQESTLMENEYSVNIPTLFTFKKKIHSGWINVVNPFRAGMVLGTPGSGKSYAIVNNYIRQQIEKGFTMFIYDFKFPDLSRIAYFYLLKNKHVYQKKYGLIPRFYTINFDDPRRSHRCNPLLSRLMTDIIDAQEASSTILLNLNKTWIQKQGDFFVESPITFLMSCIWYMKRFNDRQIESFLATLPEEEREKPGIADHINYCTFPHIIEFANHEYEEIFPLMAADTELENLIQPFFSALKNGAKEQLEGQIASARIPLSRMASPSLYWVMTGNDFSLDINNPAAPKILCVGNNPDRQSVYGAALGLYNARMIKLVNRKGKLKSSLIVDELPTIYMRGLDNLIATGRSNKVSTLLGLQDLTQLIRDYGDKEAKAIFNTIGNIFSGQVLGETAKNLSSRFGKNVQQRQSFNVTEKETTTNFSTQMDSVIPESKISNLSQGWFVGAIADNVDTVVKQKIFHGQIVIDKQMARDMERLPEIPVLPAYAQLSDKQVQEMMNKQFVQVKTEVTDLIKTELDALRQGPQSYLLNKLMTADPNYLTGDPSAEQPIEVAYNPVNDEYEQYP